MEEFFWWSGVVAGGGWAVVDWRGEVLVAYRNQHNAQCYAYGLECEVHNEAECEDERRTRIAAYLAARAARPARTQAQMEMFS